MAERHNFNRVDRVSEQVHQILSQLLLRDVRDPELQKIQINDVEVSRDFQIATVYYVMMDDNPKPDKRVLRGLDRATGFLRSKLGEALTMRHTPELRFKFDESLTRGRRIEALLNSIDIPPAPIDNENTEDEDFEEE